MPAKLSLSLDWRKFWIGFEWDAEKDALSICLLPGLVLRIELTRYYAIYTAYISEPIGFTAGYSGKQDVLAEESSATFRRVSRREYEAAHE
jgi:hypothetical protein